MIASGQTERTTAKITSQHGIDCQFERVPAILYSTQNAVPLKEEAEAAASLGIDAYFTGETELSFPVEGAVCFPNQAQFSPLAFIRHICQKLDIREHTKVIKIRGNKVITKAGVMTADHIVVATHYPMRNVPGFYFLRQHQERSYVLLLGGSSCRTGENKNGGAYDALTRAAEQYYPGYKEIMRWSAQDCMTHDGIPFIGRYSVFTPGLYVITGFQKWGMTSSMIAAMILRDKLCGMENPYEKVFSPQRINLRASIGSLFTDIGMSIKGLTKGLLCKQSPRCPHMDCV
ncbi:MAG: FAD-binding oxidoreductase [Lachnospiraceae bacterium]|nr:FAD-binding oxidoreductase [Lachnospiraceae bacterium]